MQFKIDENLPIELADLLREFGYDAMTVLEQNLGGSPDEKVASICKSEKRVIVTLDSDFADIRTYPPSEFSGIIVLRLLRQDKLHVVAVFSQILDIFSQEPLAGHLWIVEENRIRIRG